MTMPINLDICNKCIRKGRKEEVDDKYGSLFNSINLPLWRLMYTCPTGGSVGKGDPPSENCPHKFEHAVAAGLTVNIDKKD